MSHNRYDECGENWPLSFFFKFSIRRRSRSFRLTVRRIGSTEAMKYFQPMYYAFGCSVSISKKNILPRGRRCAASSVDCSLPMLVTISRIASSTLLFYIQIFLGAISHGPLDFHSDIVRRFITLLLSKSETVLSVKWNGWLRWMMGSLFFCPFGLGLFEKFKLDANRERSINIGINSLKLFDSIKCTKLCNWNGGFSCVWYACYAKRFQISLTL